MKLKHRCVKDLDKNFVIFALWTAAWLSKHMRRHPVTLTICLSSSARSCHSEPFCADLRTSHQDGRAQIKWNWSTETWKDTSCFSTRQTTQFAPTQWKCFQLQRWHTGLEAKKCLRMAGMAESIITQRALSHLKSVEQVDVDLSRIWTKTWWRLPSERQHGCPKAFVRTADRLRVKFGMKSELKLLTTFSEPASKCNLHVRYMKEGISWPRVLPNNPRDGRSKIDSMLPTFWNEI